MKKLAVAVALVVAFGSLVLARSRAPEATVTYYVIPGCTTCARTAARLDQVVQRCGHDVKLRIVENTSAEGRAAARAHGFSSHGLVLTDAAGRPELVEADHRVFPEHVGAALDRILTD